MTDIANLFRRHQWSCAALEPGVWRASFTTEREEDFDLYVLVAEDWVHFAVSPLLSYPSASAAPRLYPLLLRLNQELHLARFALDDDGDVNLVADAPLARLTYPVFAEVVDWLVNYVNQLAGELGRIAQEPNYHSPLFDVTV